MFVPGFISVALLVGVVFQGASLAPVARLLQITRSRYLRRAWLVLTVMIVGFIAGYLALLGLIPRDMHPLLVRLICIVLVMGGVFVYSVAVLALQTARDISRLVHLEREVIVDPLTGAYNRRFFEEQYRREFVLAGCTGSDLSLLVIDLDHFKGVNDLHGHAAGDKVLAAIAETLSEGIRGSDILVRYGGEEFVVIAPSTDMIAAELLAERLCRGVAGTRIVCGGDRLIDVTASIGVATMSEGDTFETLFVRADAAVYDAKRAGRNRVSFGAQSEPQETARASVA